MTTDMTLTECREFESGAKRSMKVDDGWYLIPSQVIKQIWEWESARSLDYLSRAVRFTEDREKNCRLALEAFAEEMNLNMLQLLDLYGHALYTGAEKYGKFNWEKGIPFESYVSSAYRHYVKQRIGMSDENHIGAFVFNVVGAMLTREVNPKPELDTPTLIGDLSWD